MTEDTYLTVADIAVSPHGPATIDVVIQPMVLWLWVGGAVTAFGAALAAIPGRRRRRSDGADHSGHEDHADHADQRTATSRANVADELADASVARPNGSRAGRPKPAEPGMEPSPVGAGAGS